MRTVEEKRPIRQSLFIFLPYMGLSASPAGSLVVARAQRRLRIFDALFINRLVVGQKST